MLEPSHSDVYSVLTVHDEDHGMAGRIKSVDITEGDIMRTFSIEKTLVQNEYIIVRNHLNNPKLFHQYYNLTITALDGGVPSRSSSISLAFELKSPFNSI